jgi:membrane dipeptidase
MTFSADTSVGSRGEKSRPTEEGASCEPRGVAELEKRFGRVSRSVLRRLALDAVVLALLLVLLGRYVERFVNRVVGQPPPPVSPQARALHRSSFIADLHADSLLWNRDLARRSTVGHADLPRLRAGNVALQVLTIVTRVPASASIERTDPRWPDLITLLALTNGWPMAAWTRLADRALYQANKLAALAAGDPHLMIVRSRADLERLAAEHARDPRWVGAILGIEGAHALDRPAALDELFAAGVRLIGLAHFFDNEYAGSAHGLLKGGLTPRGRDLVSEMERRGIVVDLTHSSAATVRDVLAVARRPPLVSHTGVLATCGSPRNLSDRELLDVAAAGGLIGIGAWTTAVCGYSAAAAARAIHHAVALVGDEHVALGSDFDGAVDTPFDASHLDVLTEAMLDEGLSAESVRKILGTNALRVLHDLLPPG